MAHALQKLFVPTPEQKPTVKRIGEQLTKAISGARAIEMLKQREMKRKRLKQNERIQRVGKGKEKKGSKG